MSILNAIDFFAYHFSATISDWGKSCPSYSATWCYMKCDIQKWQKVQKVDGRNRYCRWIEFMAFWCILDMFASLSIFGGGRWLDLVMVVMVGDGPLTWLICFHLDDILDSFGPNFSATSVFGTPFECSASPGLSVYCISFVDITCSNRIYVLSLQE